MTESIDNQLVFDNNDYSELEESIRKLTLASEEQFETIKKEKWYRQLWDKNTFSKKGEMRLCDQISTLAQAKQIFAQMLLKESQQNKVISELVNNNATYIKKLAGQSVSFTNKLTSLRNLTLLLNEINNGFYNVYRPITAICIILSQLDNDVLDDTRAVKNIILSLINHNVINNKNIEVIDFLLDCASMTEKDVPLVYTELSSIRDNYYANLVLSIIEELYFKQNNSSNKDDIVLNIAIAHNVEKKYDSTTLIKIFISLLNSIIAEKAPEGIFTVTNVPAKQKREEAEKLFYAGKLTDAYPIFIEAAKLGDARACYFVACYYFDAYGTTKKNEELYKKYIDLGIERKDPFCSLEYSRYLFNQGDKTKSDYWRSKILPKIGKLAEKGDAVACDLLARVAYYYFMDEYSLLQDKIKELNEEEKRRMNVFGGIYRTYSAKAVDAGYWPMAFSKCFSLEIILDGGDREKNIEQYGWMFENVEWASIHTMLGEHYLSLDTAENRYYKNAAASFVKAYELQKEDSLCGFISFFLKTGVISESKTSGILKKDIDILYHKGLDSDNPTALLDLGLLYFIGVGEKHLGKNEFSAFEHFDRAYEKYDNVRDFPGKKIFDKGKSFIAFYLGYMLLNGIGTERNNEKAVQYLEYAVQNDENKAIRLLADCYLNGIGVKKDLNKYNELIAKIMND